MSQTTTTIDDFLEPWGGPNADELRHRVAGRKRRARDGRYEELGRVEGWDGFNLSRISSNLGPCLAIRFEPQWQAWIADLARIIYNERQLEAFYDKTFITRVNIALQNAIPQHEPRVTIVEGPGSFDSYDPDYADGKETVILPDWIVIEGSYSPIDIDFPAIENLASERKILAVGDTKLVLGLGEEDVVPGTYSCLKGDLAQVQHYSRMLRTRFGFILSNTELVVAQFLREEDATPRQLRGLRSSTRPGELHTGVRSNFNSSDPWSPVENESDVGDEPSLPTPLQDQKKRRYEDSHHPSTTPQRVRPKEQYTSSPPPQFRSLPWQSSSPAPPLTSHRSRLTPSDGTSASPGGNSLPPPSSYTAAEPEITLPSSTSYAPSERSYQVGRVLVRRFLIPNLFDRSNVDGGRKKSVKAVDMLSDGTQRIHPCKALFALLMLARSAGLAGRSIGTEEVEF